MSIGYVLMWMIGISVISLFIRVLRTPRRRNRGWLVVCGIILAAMAFTSAIDLDLAGWVGLALWIPLILIPGTGSRWIDSLCVDGKFHRAKLISYGLRCFHPADGYWELPRILSALELAERGALTNATQIFATIGHGANAVGRAAIAQLFSLTGQWDGLVAWVTEIGGAEILERDPTVLAIYLRALGEIGRTEHLIGVVSRFKETIEASGPNARSTSHLFALAFGGRPAAVKELLDGPLSHFPETTKQFWNATALLASGHPEANEMFRFLANASDPRLRRSAERRLVFPLPVASQVVSQFSEAVLNGIQRDALASLHAPLVRKKLPRPWITYGLAGANIAVFVAELFMGGSLAGSEETDLLLLLGALIPELVVQGQWWRILTANFLHFGQLHLSMNLFALLVMGPFVERTLGKFRYLVLYIVAGLGSMGTVTVLVIKGFLKPQILVGASGAIMGLFGATAAYFLMSWHRERSPQASARLRSIGLTVLIQVAFDLSTRQVSFTAHMAGAITGFIVGLLLRETLPDPHQAENY